MRVLVTGGTGYLGRTIVLALASHGHTPIVFARAASRSGLPGQLVDGDIRDRGAVSRAADGVEAVCHAAALVSIWRARREEFDEINIRGLENVIDVCRRYGLARLVYTSSFLALPPAGQTAPLAANDYQRTKVAGLAIARAAAARGMPIVSMCPGVVYGPGTVTEGNLVGRLVRDHLERRLPGIIGADRVWSFAYVDDVAAAHVAALKRGEPGREYLVGGENAPQMRVFEILRRLRGTSLPRRIPYAVATAAAYIEEALAVGVGRPPLVTRGAVEIFRHDWPLDSQPSVVALGYTVTPLEQGLRRLLDGGARDGSPPAGRP
jgi:nucleoside-diphosphate-sugar epimerase